MNSTIVYYGGQEIRVNHIDAQVVIDAMKDVNRGVSQFVMLSNGWTLVIGPGIPIALHMPQGESREGPSLGGNPSSAGPAPAPSRNW